MADHRTTVPRPDPHSGWYRPLHQPGDPPETRITVNCEDSRHQGSGADAECMGWVAPKVYPNGVRCGCPCHENDRPTIGAALAAIDERAAR